VYNKTVEYLKQKGTKANWISIKTGILSSLPVWTKEVPFQIKSIAIKDACLAVKAAKKKYKATGKFNEVKYKSRKDRQQTIFIPKSAVKSGKGFYVTLLKTMYSSELFPEAEYDCRMSYSGGRWYLIIPVKTTDMPERQGKAVAVDPGVRTFLTFYSSENCGKLGCGDFSRIQRLCHYADDLLSRISKAKLHRQRHNMRKALDRIRWKIKDLIDELHHKTALFLVSNFSLIIIPRFETSEMTKRAGRKIRSKTVRSMLTFSHYRFQEFLKHKAKEYGSTVIHQDEAYTSKTCSWNGKMKKIGSAKYIKDGNIVVDRDYNGARGIFLRALRDPAMPGKLAWHAMPNVGTIGNYGGLLVG
jgi:putative transposase